MKNHGNINKAVSIKFGIELDMTYREISEELGVSYQAIQQTEKVAMRKFEKKFRIMFPDTWPILQDEIKRGKFGIDTISFL